MDEPEVYGFLNGLFREVFMCDDIVLRPELTADDVPGWDSHRYIEIILAVEERLGIKLSTRDLDGLERVGDLVELIKAKTAVAR